MSLISKDDVLGYTSIAKVTARGDKLLQDITRAEKMVFEICGHQFTGTDATTGLPLYPTIPEDVKLATILWTEYYALKEIGKETEGIKSETLLDYAYVKANNASVAEPDTYLLLKPYIIADAPSTSKAVLKFRAIG